MLRRIPYTLAVTALLLGTTLAVHGDVPGAVSTNVDNFAAGPGQALVALVSSAFVVAGQWWFWALMVFAASGALELNRGAKRTAFVFWSGHILASVVMTGWVWCTTEPGDWLRSQPDYGVSFGLFALAGAGTWFLKTLPLRLLWLALVLVGVGVLAGWSFPADDTASWGHLLSVFIGIATGAPKGSASPGKAPRARR